MNKKYFFSVLLLSFSMVSTIKTMDDFGFTPDQFSLTRDEIAYYDQLQARQAEEQKNNRLNELLAAINAQNHELVQAIIDQIYRESSSADKIILINSPVDDQGTTLLMKAASIGDMTMVRLLLDSEADATLTNADGQTAEQIATNNSNRYQEIARYLYNYTHAIYE
jgi:ankyrin repeat protein